MMSDESALIPLEQRTIEFEGDELVAVLVDRDEPEPQVYVPIRPLCDYLGISFTGQRQRILRDPVLSDALETVLVARPARTGGGTQEMLCLPLKYLNGWLFGISPTRVKKELQEKIVQYQRDCYDILARAFQARQGGPADSSLARIREMGLAIAEMAEQQMLFEQGLAATNSRLDQAALVVGSLQKRMTTLEKRLSPGQLITDEQAAEISNQVRNLALLLTEGEPQKNHYQGVFMELYRRFGVSSYKLIPQSKYAAVLAFLDEWWQRATAGGRASQETVP